MERQETWDQIFQVTNTEFEKTNYEKFKYGMELYNSSGWKLVKKISSQHDITIEKKTIEGSRIVCFKFETLIDARPFEACEKFWEVFPLQSDKLDKTVKLLENITEGVLKNKPEYPKNADIRFYHQINKIFPFWPRENLYVQQKMHNGESSAVMAYSIDEKIFYPNGRKNNNVFVDLSIGFYMFTPVKDKTKITQIIHADPGGLIPSVVVNNYFDENVVSMVRYVQNHFAKK